MLVHGNPFLLPQIQHWVLTGSPLARHRALRNSNYGIFPPFIACLVLCARLYSSLWVYVCVLTVKLSDKIWFPPLGLNRDVDAVIVTRTPVDSSHCFDDLTRQSINNLRPDLDFELKDVWVDLRNDDFNDLLVFLLCSRFSLLHLFSLSTSISLFEGSGKYCVIALYFLLICY